MGWIDNLSPDKKIAIIIVILILIPILGPPFLTGLFLVLVIGFMFFLGGIPLLIGVIILLLIIFIGIPLIVEFISVNKKSYKNYEVDSLGVDKE
tara:strand:+ start:492 stop:773 length:282 start_codon:yes stop_codon:yes gene_type:complete